jgi:hypothetical protein
VGADLERRVAWFLHLLDAYDPGRLGRAVDVRPTALDHASRKAVPTMSAPTHHTPTPTPEWGAQPPTPNPKPKRRGRKLLIALSIVGGLLLVGAVVGNETPSDPAPSDPAPAAAAAPKPKPKPKSGVSQGLGAKDASADVKIVAFTEGEFSSEVELLITNHSEGRSDYYVELSLTDASGTNVGWTNATAMAVEPGQKARVTAPVVEDGAVKAKVHEVQRTASV